MFQDLQLVFSAAFVAITSGLLHGNFEWQSPYALAIV